MGVPPVSVVLVAAPAWSLIPCLASHLRRYSQFDNLRKGLLVRMNWPS